MGTGRRLAALLLVVAVVGLPAVALRAECLGASCRSTTVEVAPAPFCSLPTDLRALVSAGAYEGRSADVLGIAGSTPVVSDANGVEVPWPSEAQTTRAAMAVPLEFIGRGVQNGKLPASVTLDQVAPTLEPLLGLHRAHANVRTGTAIPRVVAPGATSPLVVLIAWKGVGTPGSHGDRMPPNILANAPRSGDPGSMSSTNAYVEGKLDPTWRGVRTAWGDATSRSLPLDPTAVETTIGTGGIPSQHGVTGATIRNPNTGKIVHAFGPSSPQPVIATLGDDLDQATAGGTKIGLIATATGDAGLTGDAWYGTGSIRDRTVRMSGDVTGDIGPFLADRWGADRVPDLLAIGMEGSMFHDARATAAIEADVLRAVPDATIVIAGTGSVDVKDPVAATLPAGAVATTAGGVFVDRNPGAPPAQTVVDAMKQQTAPDGTPLYADAFASYAVRFGRYC